MQASRTYFDNSRFPAAGRAVYDRSYRSDLNAGLHADQIKAARALLIAAPIAMILWSSVFALIW